MRLQLSNPAHDDLVAYELKLGLPLESSNFIHGFFPDQEFKLTDRGGIEAYGLLDNIQRSFLIALDNYL